MASSTQERYFRSNHEQDHQNIELAAGQLAPGEELIAGLRVNLKGTALGVGLSAGVGGLAGLALGAKSMNEGQDQARIAGIPFAQQMALGLTNQRLIVKIWRMWRQDIGNRSLPRRMMT